MEQNRSELSELLKFIEMNKHDVTMRVRSIVLDPIQSINRPEAATDSYFREVGIKNEEINSLAQEIMEFFAKKWRNPNDTEETQLKSMKQNIANVVSVIIPQIRIVVAFYESCSQKKYYFTTTDKGKKALEKMTVSCSLCERVCESLLKLEGNDAKNADVHQLCNLLEILQEGLDAIDAEVKYVKEWEASKIAVSINPDIFLNHVLINIRENINTHAFGTSKYIKKFVWEKKVIVEIEDKDSTITILISNNGEPFTGDISKVFEYGYCHGEKKHSGIGMHSIKKSMRELGGDVDFVKSNNLPYTTTYKLILKK
ncbi:MAG: hypothetical protein K6F78_09735 [Bacteroidaceae bacterium]|nr:hypothetical protein [Bacteroidaceae bacterium]